MPVEPMDLVENDDPASNDPKSDRLNNRVAIVVALLATFMAVCTIKDDNIVQSMQQAQVDKLDYWAWYQATKVRIDVDETAVAQLQLQKKLAPVSIQPDFDKRLEVFEKEIAKQDQKRKKIQSDAEAAQADYDRLGRIDDQFDLAEAILSISISLLAMTALTQKRWLFWVAIVPSVIGVILAIAAFAGLNIHPDFIIQYLV